MTQIVTNKKRLQINPKSTKYHEAVSFKISSFSSCPSWWQNNKKRFCVMRILILSQWFQPEPFYKGVSFAQELVKLGHEVEVLSGFPNYPGGKLYDGYKIKFFQREMIDGIEYNVEIKQYVATAMTGEEIYGATWADCEARLREANRAWIEHCKKCPTDYDGGHWRANTRRLRDGL